MIKKEYFSPQAEEMYLKMEGPLCTSVQTANDLPDFDLLTGSIDWDD